MATIEEIFSKVAARMLEGLMFHEQMSSYYDFLNLCGYSKSHEKHYWDESKNYMCLKRYYMDHYAKLLKEEEITNPKVIPSSWHNYVKENVDINTKRNSVKTGLEKWMKWETGTKEVYEKAFIDLMGLGAIHAAMFIKKFIDDVDCELCQIKTWYITKQDSDFSITSILNDQEEE